MFDLMFELWLRWAGPPKIERNFLRECDLTVSASCCSMGAQRLEWWFYLFDGTLADCWYLEVLLSSSISDLECNLDCWWSVECVGCTYLNKLFPFLLFSFPYLFFFINVKISKY